MFIIKPVELKHYKQLLGQFDDLSDVSVLVTDVSWTNPQINVTARRN